VSRLREGMQLTLTRLLRLACDGCDYRGSRRPLYPTADEKTLCNHCAYAAGLLSGKERRRYIGRHPLRAAWWVLRRCRIRARPKG